jgi:chaperonin GroEL
VAGLLLTTEAVICDLPEKKVASPAGPGGMGMDDY